MVFELKPVLESGGITFTSIGGNESLGPPAGGIILAQPVRATIFRIKMIERKKREISFIKILPFINQVANLACLLLIALSNFPRNPQNPVNPGFLILVFLLFQFMQCNGHIICFNKIAPVTIGFTTTDIKIPVLYLLPNGFYLLCYGFNIGRFDN